MREVQGSAESCVWVCYPSVLWSRFRSGSLCLQDPSDNGAISPNESELEVFLLILVPVEFAGFDQIGLVCRQTLPYRDYGRFARDSGATPRGTLVGCEAVASPSRSNVIC